MKAKQLNMMVWTVVVAVGCLGALRAGAGELPRSDAEITSIYRDKSSLVIKAVVRVNVARVVLEGRSRLATGNWAPIAVQQINPAPAVVAENVVEFRIEPSKAADFLRLRGDYTEALPSSLYGGTNTFYSVASTGGAPGVLETMAPTADASRTADPAATRDVVESDIWRIDGDTLYFFNQYAGLQVIDVSAPDSPKLLGAYPAAGAGEDMYLLSSNKVALLTRDMCAYGSDTESAVVLLNVKNGLPEPMGQVPMAGSLRDSRLVGTALYTVADRYRVTTQTTNTVWEWGCEVSSIDLSDPSTPITRNRVWLAGYGNAVYATDQYLFVAAPQPGANSLTTVHVFDISNPDGTMVEVAAIPVDGTVKDKFKMNLNGAVFSVVTENWSKTQETRVTTYSLSDPKNPVRLGSVKIIERETLFATRFAGNLLYAVTFLRVDPLWVIDLSSPEAPQKVGELEIPGWSSYIYPWGDRLITIGVDTTENLRRAAVQLFDVHDPAKPALLSKVLLGDKYSYSEANENEKAFGILPDDKLILVPLYTYGTNGSLAGVQLVDLEHDSLRKRGFLEQPMAARRATVHRDRILSLTGRELLAVDASNRDKPSVTGRVALSWQVDHVLLSGNYLIEISLATGSEPARLRVTEAENPLHVLSIADLGKEQISGAELKNNRLYLFQTRGTEILYDQTTWTPIGTNDAAHMLTVFDTADLPAIKLISTVKQASSAATYFASWYDALWVRDDVLVWATRNRGSMGYPWYYYARAVDLAVAAPGRMAIFAPWYWWGAENVYYAYDAAKPGFLSETRLNVTNSYSFSQSFPEGSLVYSSHAASEFDATIIPPPVIYQKWDGGTNYVWVTNQPPPGTWIQKQYLDVVDFTDPKEPVVRKPVNIPGTLQGISHRGEVAYTQNSESSWKDNTYRQVARIQASAYDGVKASLLDTLELVDSYSTPAAVAQGTLFLGRVAAAGAPARVEAWKLAEDTGKLKLQQSVNLKSDPSVFALHDDGRMLAIRHAGVELLRLAPAAAVSIGFGNISGCTYVSIEDGDGTVERGLWLPVQSSMVQKIPVRSP